MRRLLVERLFPQYTLSHTQAGGGDTMFWGYVLLNFSGIRVCVRADIGRYRLSIHHCAPVAPVHGICLPNRKRNVPTGQRSVSQGSKCVGVVPET